MQRDNALSRKVLMHMNSFKKSLQYDNYETFDKMKSLLLQTYCNNTC